MKTDSITITLPGMAYEVLFQHTQDRLRHDLSEPERTVAQAIAVARREDLPRGFRAVVTVPHDHVVRLLEVVEAAKAHPSCTSQHRRALARAAEQVERQASMARGEAPAPVPSRSAPKPNPLQPEADDDERSWLEWIRHGESDQARLERDESGRVLAASFRLSSQFAVRVALQGALSAPGGDDGTRHESAEPSVQVWDHSVDRPMPPGCPMVGAWRLTEAMRWGRQVKVMSSFVPRWRLYPEDLQVLTGRVRNLLADTRHLAVGSADWLQRGREVSA